MKPTLAELKERAQNPGEVFSRGEMLHCIEVAEYYAEQFEKEAWARIDWKEQCGIAEAYLAKAVELLLKVTSDDLDYHPDQVNDFLCELKRVGLATNQN